MADHHEMPLHQARIIGTRHMVSSANHLAAQAGLAILEAGGNAVDAGVAGGIALGVLQCEYVHFAGVAPMVIHMAETGQTHTISGLGPWPRKASAAYLREHHAGRIPNSILRTVVPAAPEAWITALQRFGTMSFGEVAQAAIRFGREGFAVQSISNEVIADRAEAIAAWPENARIYLPDGKPPVPGSRFFQTDLANTIQYMADQEAAAARNGGREAGLRRGARRLLPRGDRPQDRRLPRRTRRLACRRRPRRLPRGRRGTAVGALRRRGGARLRPVVPGTGAAADARAAGRHRPAFDGP